MTSWTEPAPAQPEKSTFLHDRKNRPSVPPTSLLFLLRSHLVLLIGIAASLGFTALAFQARATWGGERDWVVPMTVPFYALGGVAIGYLIARRQEVAAFGIVLALAAVGLAVVDAALDAGDETKASTSDAVSIFLGITIGVAIAVLVATLAWVEAKRPTKAPPPG